MRPRSTFSRARWASGLVAAALIPTWAGTGPGPAEAAVATPTVVAAPTATDHIKQVSLSVHVKGRDVRAVAFLPPAARGADAVELPLVVYLTDRPRPPRYLAAGVRSFATGHDGRAPIVIATEAHPARPARIGATATALTRWAITHVSVDPDPGARVIGGAAGQATRAAVEVRRHPHRWPHLLAVSPTGNARFPARSLAGTSGVVSGPVTASTAGVERLARSATKAGMLVTSLGLPRPGGAIAARSDGFAGGLAFLGAELGIRPPLGSGVDHVTAEVTGSVPAASTVGDSYSIQITITNTFPTTFPPVQVSLLTTVRTGQPNLRVDPGTCGHQLSSGSSCTMTLTLTPTTAGEIAVGMQVAVGALYYLELPSATTAASN